MREQHTWYENCPSGANRLIPAHLNYGACPPQVCGKYYGADHSWKEEGDAPPHSKPVAILKGYQGDKGVKCVSRCGCGLTIWMCYTSHHSVQNPLAECIGGGCIGRPQRPACSKCATNLMEKEGVQMGEGQFEGHLQRELCSCQTVSMPL